MSDETYNPLLETNEIKAEAVREFNKKNNSSNKEQSLNQTSDQTKEAEKSQAKEEIKVEPVTLKPEIKKDFLNQFKNLGVSFGFAGGTRDKLADAFDKAEFHKAKDAVVITKNSQEENSYQITFNGNCDKVAAIPLGHDCYIKATYNKEKGTVGIVSSTVFHIKDGKERVYNFNFDREGKEFLDKDIGKDKASQVLHNFNNTKVLVCANPQDNQKNGEEHSVSGVAALINGKTHGVQAGRKTMLAGVAVCGVLGAGAAATGFGAPATIGLLSAAIALSSAYSTKLVLKDYGPRLENSSSILVEKDISNSNSVTIEKQSVVSKGQENQKNNSNSSQKEFLLNSPDANLTPENTLLNNYSLNQNEEIQHSSGKVVKSGSIISKIYEWFFPPEEKPKTAVHNHNIINITQHNNADNNQTQSVKKDSTKKTESEAVLNPLANADNTKQNNSDNNQTQSVKKDSTKKTESEAVLNPLANADNTEQKNAEEEKTWVSRVTSPGIKKSAGRYS